MSLEFHEDAVADLDAIYDHIAAENPAAAQKVITRIVSLAELVAKRPLIGRTGILPETRELSVTGYRYKIVYQTRSNGVLVTNIIHTSQNWP